jgi:hypothetical protein
MSLDVHVGTLTSFYGAAVAAWLPQLEAQLGMPCDWDERDEKPIAVEQVGSFVGLDALHLAAAYHMQPHLTRPTQLPENLTDDAAWIASTREDFPSRFRQIIGPSVWLPRDFDFRVRLKGPSGQARTFASAMGLLRQLELLNTERFHGTEAELEAWREVHDAELFARDPLEYYMRWALAGYLKLARLAVGKQLPMLLSY